MKPAGSRALMLSADRPIASRAEDLLRRGRFAERIANAIASWTQSDSLVIGLYGPWGGGKSSVKNLVLEALRDAEAPTVLEFNPWQWRGHEEVASAFFRDTLRSLGQISDATHKRELAKRIRRYAKFLALGGAVVDPVRPMVGKALGLLGLLAVGWPLFGEPGARFVQAIGLAVAAVAGLLLWGEKVLDRSAEWLESQEYGGSLQEQKRAIAEALTKRAKPILVVIDDLDRLSATEIRAVFQLIKANADFPHFIYLVLFQRDIVERALEEEVNEEGAKYLEKIVQIGFDLPTARKEDIEALLTQGLDVLLEKDLQQFDQAYWVRVYHAGLRQCFATLRDVKRFLGTLDVHLRLLRSDGILEVNSIDVIALEAMRVFEPRLHGLLRMNKELLTSRGSEGDREERKAKCDTLVEAVSPPRQEGVREMLKELFPPAGPALGRHYGGSVDARWLKELRVCSSEMFDRYFEYSLSPRDVSQAEIARLLALASNGKTLTQELMRFANDGRLMTALERFEANVEKISPDQIADVLIALFNAGAHLPEAVGFFETPPHWLLMRFTGRVLKREPDLDRREAALKRALLETESLGIAVLEIARESKDEERAKNPDTFMLRKQSLPQFQALCVDMIRKAAKDGGLYKTAHLAHLLYRWRDWAGTGEPIKWVTDLVLSDLGAIMFLKAFLHASTVQSGDDLPKTRHFIRLSEIELFADLSQLEKSLEHVSLVKLGEQDRIAVEEFRKALVRRSAGVKEDGFWAPEES